MSKAYSFYTFNVSSLSAPILVKILWKATLYSFCIVVQVNEIYKIKNNENKETKNYTDLFYKQLYNLIYKLIKSKKDY